MHVNRIVRSSRLLVLGALVAAGAALVPAPAAWAGVSGMTVTPTTLPAGDSISVSSTGCFGDDLPTVDIGVYAGTTTGTDLPSGSPIVAASPSPDASTGAWGTSLTIPADTAPGAYTLHARCNSDTSDFIYDNVAITVTGVTTSTAPATTEPCVTTTTMAATTTTTLAPTTTTEPPVEGKVAAARLADPCAAPTTTTPSAAAPATAVAAQPTFTG